MTAMTVQTASIPRIMADEFLSGDYQEGSELIDGVVYEVDPAIDHQEVGARLLDEIRAWVRAEPGRGRAGYGGNWVLSDGHVYKADVWWKAQRPRGVRNDGPPELAVEVRSPGTWALDIGPKLRRYEASGAVEVWLVDTPSSTVLILRRDESGPGFADVVEVGLGAVLDSPLLPGFELDVDELFADLGESRSDHLDHVTAVQRTEELARRGAGEVDAAV